MHCGAYDDVTLPLATADGYNYFPTTAPVCIVNLYDHDSDTAERLWVNHESSSSTFPFRWEHAGVTRTVAEVGRLNQPPALTVHSYFEEPTNDCWIASALPDLSAPLNCRYRHDLDESANCRSKDSSLSTPNAASYGKFFKCYSGVCGDQVGAYNPAERRRRKLHATETPGSTITWFVTVHNKDLLGLLAELQVHTDRGNPAATKFSLAAELQGGAGVNTKCGALGYDSTVLVGQAGCVSPDFDFDSVHNHGVDGVYRWKLVTTLGATFEPPAGNAVVLAERGTQAEVHVILDAASGNVTVEYNSHPLIAPPPSPQPILIVEAWDQCGSESCIFDSELSSCVDKPSITGGGVDVTARFQVAIDMALARGASIACLGE